MIVTNILINLKLWKSKPVDLKLLLFELLGLFKNRFLKSDSAILIWSRIVGENCLLLCCTEATIYSKIMQRIKTPTKIIKHTKNGIAARQQIIGVGMLIIKNRQRCAGLYSRLLLARSRGIQSHSSEPDLVSGSHIKHPYRVKILCVFRSMDLWKSVKEYERFHRTLIWPCCSVTLF